MQVRIHQKTLAHAISIVNHAVNARGALPGNILLRADGSRFTLSATNLEIGIIHTSIAQVLKTGAITVPAKQFADYVITLPRDIVELTLNPKTQALHLKCTRFEANIKGMDESEFPIIPTFEKQDHVLIEPDVLKELLARALISVAQDNPYPVFKNIYAAFNGAVVTFAATDGFRLTVTCETLLRAFTKQTQAALIPSKAIKELVALLGKMEDPITIEFSANGAQVLFNLAGTLVIANLAEGNFPDYNQIVPKSHTMRAVCNTFELTQSVKAALVFAQDASFIIRLKFQPETAQSGAQLFIFGQNAEFGDETNSIDIQMDDGKNELLEIALNGNYMLDVLGVINAPQVAFELNTSASPVVVKPVGTGNFTHVIMPMRIRDEETDLI